MKIILNGEAREVSDGLSIRALVEQLGLPAEAVLVEHNEVALFKREWNEATLKEGDRIEIVRVVAGG